VEIPKMRGNTDVLRHLNTVLKCQLTAINQLFLHARMARHRGLGRLNEREYARSIAAMKAVDALMERILLLEGLPNLQDLGKLFIGEDVPEILAHDLTLLKATRDALLAAIANTESAQDYVSRELLEDQLEKVEEHIDWLETQHHLIGEIGIGNYLQSMM
jgi:bacterioferritin